MTEQTTQRTIATPLVKARNARPVIGLVAGGLGAYWPQFPELLPMLRRSTELVSERLKSFDADIVDVGFISDASEAVARSREAARRGLRSDRDVHDDLHDVEHVVPIGQRAGAPLLLLNLQPTESMDHANFDTGKWLAYCGACPLPEVAKRIERCGIPFRSVSGYLADERAWARNRALGPRGRREPRASLGPSRPDGPLYPGMLDVATDITLVPAHLGGHVRDPRVRTTSGSAWRTSTPTP